MARHPLEGMIDENTKPLAVGVGAFMMNAAGEICGISRKARPTDSEIEAARRRRDIGLPGGKKEVGETELEAVLREVLEELGIRATRLHRLFAAVDGDGYWFVTFLVVEWEGDVHDAEGKGAVVGWWPPLRFIQPECSFRDYNKALFQYLGLIA